MSILDQPCQLHLKFSSTDSKVEPKHIINFKARLFPDLVSNPAMARQGFSRMAVSACFGGPLLSILSVTAQISHYLGGKYDPRHNFACKLKFSE